MTLKSPTSATGVFRARRSLRGQSAFQTSVVCSRILVRGQDCRLAGRGIRQNPVISCFDIAAVSVVRTARKASPRFLRVCVPCEYGNAIPTFLSQPDCIIAGFSIDFCGNFSWGAFSSCRQTTSGLKDSSHRKSMGRRPLIPFTLKVAIFILGTWGIDQTGQVLAQGAFRQNGPGS